MLRLKGVDAEVTYDCDPTKDEPTIFMSTHASSLDIFATAAYSITPISWIMKRSLSFIPWYGIVAMKGGNVPINRKKRDSAIESLKMAANQIRKEKKKLVLRLKEQEGGRRVLEV